MPSSNSQMASVAAIDYRSGRKLNKALIERMANCEYITEYRNIFITGATGSGKSYMVCAFGMEACKQYYTVQSTSDFQICCWIFRQHAMKADLLLS